jgi:hypothetical protein
MLTPTCTGCTLPWSGTVSGMVGPNAITLSLHASGVFDGSICDTGPVSLTLDQHAI